MKNSLFIILFALFSSTVFAEPLETIQLANNRVLGYHANLVEGDQSPVLVFMPGIYRGHYAKETFLKALKKMKVSYVAFHFAEQPESVALSSDKAPDFSNITAKDLAQEVSALVKELQISNAVPVSLSYSAVVTQHLDASQFPFVIETAPIGKDTDGMPQSVIGFYEFWEAWMKSIPFYGEIWIRQTKEYHLRNHWTPTVEEYSAGLPILKKPAYKERAVQGYIALTRSSENFDFRNQEFGNGPLRYFIIGAEEAADRLQIQKEGIEKYQKESGHLESVFVVEGAGHIVPADQPEAYADLLKQIRDQIGSTNQPL